MNKFKFFRVLTAIAFTFAVSMSANAQFGNALKKTKDAVKQEVKQEAAKPASQTATASSTPSASPAGQGSNASQAANSSSDGKTLYVSVSTGAGSRTADGSKEKPYKDLQAALDAAEHGDFIKVAEGNYLGKMDQGYIDVVKYVTVEGGWNTDFTERDFVKYQTMIQPTSAQAGTSGAHALMDLHPPLDVVGNVLIDGIVFDMGYFNLYCKAPNTSPVASAPEGCETGRIVCVGESPQAPATDGVTNSRQCLFTAGQAFKGNLTVRNCVFANAMHYAIQMLNNGGYWEFHNNIFVACRMAACEVRGGGKLPETQRMLNFHHNTVLFTWTRTKLLEDMGYGFRYMTQMNYDVHDNIFGCNYYGALDRTRFDSDLKRDKERVTNAFDNLFFANRMGDICLPSGGGKWNFQYAKNFEEVEQLTKYEGNREVNESEAKSLENAISSPYLKGYLGLTMSQKSEFQENSVMNTYRAAHGMNKQGTETVRVSMYGNRYPIAEVSKLWGTVAGKGAQSGN